MYDGAQGRESLARSLPSARAGDQADRDTVQVDALVRSQVLDVLECILDQPRDRAVIRRRCDDEAITSAKGIDELDCPRGPLGLGLYIGRIRSGPAINKVAEPSAAAACKLTVSARSVTEAGRVVPPMPSMIGFATPAFISGVELPKRASPVSALANDLGTTRLQANPVRAHSPGFGGKAIPDAAHFIRRHLRPVSGGRRDAPKTRARAPRHRSALLLQPQSDVLSARRWRAKRHRNLGPSR